MGIYSTHGALRWINGKCIIWKSCAWISNAFLCQKPFNFLFYELSEVPQYLSRFSFWDKNWGRNNISNWSDSCDYKFYNPNMEMQHTIEDGFMKEYLRMSAVGTLRNYLGRLSGRGETCAWCGRWWNVLFYWTWNQNQNVKGHSPSSWLSYHLHKAGKFRWAQNRFFYLITKSDMFTNIWGYILW